MVTIAMAIPLRQAGPKELHKITHDCFCQAYHHSRRVHGILVLASEITLYSKNLSIRIENAQVDNAVCLIAFDTPGFRKPKPYIHNNHVHHSASEKTIHNKLSINGDLCQSNDSRLGVASNTDEVMHSSALFPLRTIHLSYH